MSSFSPAEVSAAKRLLLERRLQGATAHGVQGTVIPRTSREEPLPLSFAQQRLWFLDQLAPGNPVYNIFEALRLKGPLDAAVLEWALREIVKRHEAVRTIFPVKEGKPAQVVVSEPEFALSVERFDRFPPQQREQALRQHLATETAKPFDLTRDLMLRAVLCRLDTEEHVLLICMHHIASDGWSLGVLWQELSVLYNSRVKGTPAALPDLPIQYADYAVWQRQWLTGEILQQQLNYWKRQLAGAPELLDLPTDRHRPVVQSFRGASHSLVLPLSLARALKTLSREEGATLYMTLLAGFQALLHRYSGQNEIVVGSPISGRNQFQTEGLIGFFVNTLVMRTDLTGAPTFRELLRRVREVTLDAYAAQDLPLEKLVMELQPERSSSHTPLFQVAFAFQSARSQPVELSGLTTTAVEVDNGTAKFDLTLAMAEVENGLRADLEFNLDIWDPSTVRPMLDHLQALLEGIVAHPEQPITELSILTAAERHQLVTEWNRTQAECPRDKSVPAVFEIQAEHSPEAIAVQADRQYLTYRELNARANQLAWYLRSMGVNRGQCVGIYLDRSIDLIVAFLGVLKAGAAYLPLDTSYPEERLSFMLADSQTPLVITQHRLAAGLKTSARAIFLDAEARTIQGQDRANPPWTLGSEDMAYVIYTSGSTGKPKGVCIPHRGILRLVLNGGYVNLDPSDVVAQASNCSFDAATFEIWGALLNGARLALLAPDVLLSPQQLAEQLKRQRVTTLFLTTALFNQLARELPHAFSSLRHLLFGGEKVDPRWVTEVMQNSPPQRLLHVYGPTEATTFASWYHVRSTPEPGRSVPIGRPISNTELYVLDEYRQPVPIGVRGELYIGGEGLALGYLNRAELTRERFIPNPFSPKRGQLYRTGDMVRYLPDGNLEFLGRVDLQVKIRGFRIELGEVESVLNNHPGVRDCAVTAREDTPGEKKLVAYVVPRSKAPAEEDLREYLGRHMPEYMVPAEYVFMGELPLDANGKVKRRSLPRPASPAHPPQAYVPARDTVEAQLVTIWEEVLGKGPIGIREKFFQLGGHSLMAVRLVAQLEKVFGKKFSVSAIFQAPTIEQLAAVVRSGGVQTSSSAVVEIQSKGSKPALFFVHGVGGGMFWGYRNLSRHLGDDQPVYVLKSRAMDGSEEFVRIEDMAAHYAADLRAFQPHGPYYLGGYCFGGNVAFEMARQLRSQGETVGLLVVINCTPPNSSYNKLRLTPLFIWRFAINLCRWISHALDWSAEQRHKFLLWKLRSLRNRIFHSRDGGRPVNGKIDLNDLVDLSVFPEEQRRLWAAHIEALLQYQPSFYEGAVTLFRSRTHPVLCSFDAACGWGELAGRGVEVKVFSAPHEGILEEPHVGEVARELQACLKRAHTLDRSPTQPPPSSLPNMPSPPSPPSAEQRTTPLSAAQQWTWFMEAGGAGGNICQAIQLEGSLDRTALERSVQETVNRAEALRVHISLKDGKPVQTVHPEVSAPFAWHDLRHLHGRSDAEFERILKEEVTRPFDLSTPPLFRGCVIRTAEDRALLLLAAHPLVADHCALGSLLAYVALVYSALVNGGPMPAPGWSLQETGAMGTSQPGPSDFQEHLAFWSEHHASVEGQLQLPVDHPRKLSLNHARGQSRIWRIPTSLAQAVKALAHREGVALFVALFSVCVLMLTRYARQDQVLVRTALSGRSRSQSVPSVGRLVQELNLRIDLSAGPTIGELLRGLSALFAEASLHADLPFEHVLRSGTLFQALAHKPAVRIGWCDSASVPAELHFQGLRVRPFDLPYREPSYDLNVEFAQGQEGLVVMVRYASELFEPATIDRWLEHFASLLGAAAADPEQRALALPLLTPGEEEQVVRAWNNTSNPLPDSTCAQLFEEQAAASPDAVAVVCGSAHWTYADLDRHSSRLAAELPRGCVTAVLLERSLEFPASVLAALKAGGAFLPLDPGAPRERLELILSEAAPAVLITNRVLAEQISWREGRVICVEDFEFGPWSANRARATKPGEAKGTDHAYVMFTSGSTGRPNGVVISQRGLLNHNLCMARLFKLTPADRVLQFSALSFDISIEEMFPTWLSGACVVFRTEEVLSSMDSFLNFARTERLTVLNLPTAFWHQLVDVLERQPLPESVRLVVIGGERAAPEAYEAWKRLVPKHVSLINTYGPTETTVTATYYCARGENTLPIGRPIQNMRAYVLDGHGNPVPVGVPGELYLGGVGVGLGYLNRPELTAKRFVPDRFGAGEDEKLFRTGDLVKWRPDGNLEFIGRIDKQVKISGYRVEPAEIEAAIRQFPGVDQAIVVVRKEAAQTQRLVAYYTCKTGAELAPHELLEFVKQKVPHYMVPRAYGRLTQIPLTMRGKVDESRLPAPDSLADASEKETEPRHPLEQTVLEVWREVLGIDRIGVFDHFLELGGNSIQAMRIVSRLREIIQERIPVSTIFEFPTIAALAAAMLVGQNARRRQTLPAIKRSAKAGALSLSFAQERLWFLQELAPGDPIYNIPQAIRLRGPLDPAILTQALQEIYRRHEVLSAYFPLVEGKPAQAFGAAASLPVSQVDLTGVPKPIREQELARRMREEGRRPFNLHQDVLIRATLFALENEQHVLLLVVHHIIADAWSFAILLDELVELYKSLDAGERPGLAELPIQYGDYVLWQRERMGEDLLQGQLQFWKGEMEGAPALLELPADRPRPAIQSTSGARQPLRLSASLTGALKRLNQQEHCTTFVTLLAAFQVLLARYTGRDDIVLGSPVTKRLHPSSEKLIGMFVNTLVFRGRPMADLPFRKYLATVRTQVLGALANEDLPFEKLVEVMHPKRDRSFHPIFQVMLVLQSVSPMAKGGRLSWTPEEVDLGTSKFDLTLELNEGPDGVQGWLEYSTDLFDAWRIQAMASHFEKLVEAIVAHPDQPIGELPLLPQTEREQLEQWNRTERAFPGDACIHQLFERQAARSPKAVAVVHAGERLTYGSLNHAAERWARQLRKAGVGPDKPVAICVRRSPLMITLMLAVLKAGGAYLPLDPTYPAERLSFSIEDSGTQVLITERSMAPLFSGTRARVLWVEDPCPADDENAGWEETIVAQPENLAYVIYTSGSTGKPKGVAVTHHSAAALLHWVRETYSDEELAGVLAVTSVCFDISVFEIFGPLSWGGRIILARQALDWFDQPEAQEVTLINTVPSAMAEWVRSGKVPCSVRTVNLAGEPLSSELADAIYAQCPQVQKVYDLYGPTETTVYSTCARRERGGRATIGRPLSNEQVWLLDRRSQLVPIGVPGELFIGGAGLARGYLNRPELTAERFVSNPFQPGTRLYRTGDLARYFPNGQLQYLGRLDHQVKIRGYRIELGEIEAHLRKHPGIADSVVVASEDGSGDKRLVAYMVGKEATTPGVSELGAFLRGRLPPYMVPAVFVSLPALPRTPNGKVDRKALPAPEQARPELENRFVAPSTTTEQLLGQIWCEVLGVDRVGVHDNFFELGGHSLMITKVISRVRDAVQIELPMSAVFDSPTIAELGACIEQILLDEIDNLSEEEVQQLEADLRVNAEPSEGNLS